MQAKAVKRQATPRYPTRLQVLEDRDLLLKNLPPAWKSCAEMAGAVAILLTANNTLAQQTSTNHPSRDQAVVAPIFKHGEGRGAVGCVVVNAPVFLSEQDAMQVIREELRKSGITLSDANVPVYDVSVPQQEEKWSQAGGKLNIDKVPTGGSKPLVLQGFDPKRKIGVAVVEAEDYFSLGGPRSSSTVQGYDFEHVAEDVRNRAAANGHGLYLGTFYDPVSARENDKEDDREYRDKIAELYRQFEKASGPAAKEKTQKEIEALWNQRLNPLREKSRRQLRMQVKDFIDWLKGQGVI